jgi:hypothetical protein
MFNILSHCLQFSKEVNHAASYACTGRNKYAHLEKNSAKMPKETFQIVMDSITRLLQCLDDHFCSLALKEIQSLGKKELQIIDVAPLRRERDLLRDEVAYFRALGHPNSFTLRVKGNHDLIVPNLADPSSFFCTVLVVTGCIAVGMNVTGAVVDKGTILTGSADVVDGQISKINDAMSGEKLRNALTEMEVSLEVTIFVKDKFSFPRLEREATREVELMSKLKKMIDAGCDDASQKLPDSFISMANDFLTKKKEKKIPSTNEKLFWSAFGRSIEEAIGVAAAKFAAASKVFSSAVLPLAVSSADTRTLPQLLECYGINHRSSLEQKAYLQLMQSKDGKSSRADDEAALRILSVDPAAETAWLEDERRKFSNVPKMSKQERITLNTFALEPSLPTLHAMIMTLQSHKTFGDACFSDMTPAERLDFLNRCEPHLIAVFPLKYDREFLRRELFVSRKGAASSAPSAPP